MKKRIILLTLCLIILSIISTFFVNFKETTSKANDATNELTFKQALSIANKEALAWNTNSKLYMANSVDIPTYDNKSSGSNGMRRSWNFDFIVENSTSHLYLNIYNRKITEKRQGTGPNMYMRVNWNDVIDSTEALKQARLKRNLSPGEGFANGYHFSINLDNKGNPIFTVIGTDKNGNMSRVNLNPTTGLVESAISKRPLGGGLYYSNDKLNISSDNQLAVLNISLSPKYTQDHTLLVFALEKALSTHSKQIVKISEDSGSTWKEIPYEKPIRMIYFDTSDSNRIYLVNTDFELLVSNNRGLSWKSVYRGNQIQNVIGNNNEIYVLDNNEIITSNDSSSKWEKLVLPALPRQIAMDIHHTLYTLAKNNHIYSYNGYEWNDIKSPLGDSVKTTSMIVHDNVLFQINGDKITYFVNGVWNELNNEKYFVNVFLDNENNIYGLTRSNELYKLVEKSWKKQNFPEGNLLDLVFVKNGSFLGLSPKMQWEIMK